MSHDSEQLVEIEDNLSGVDLALLLEKSVP